MFELISGALTRGQGYFHMSIAVSRSSSVSVEALEGSAPVVTSLIFHRSAK